MNPLAWLNPGRWLLYLALAGALWLGYGAWREHQQDIGEQRATQRYETALAVQKDRADQLLATETTRAAEAERRARELIAQQEEKDANNLKTIGTLAARLRALAGPDGRLRDPNAGAGRGGGSGGPAGAPAAATADRPADPAQAGGLLSAELSGLLRARLTEADAINVAYTSCRADLLRRAAEPVGLF